MSAIKGTINNVELLGWLGNDPEMRFLANGTPVCRLSIATRRFGPQNPNGEREYETEWTSVETWERLAERCNTYLHKGSRVFVSGRLRTDSWTDKNTGQPRSRTLVRAYDVLFLDGRPGMPSEVPVAEEEEHAYSDEETPF
ncbi:single-stranded DNA-binding protein [Candidatus Viridilinea mediisalina]|uniref:Single-stranded DNA-binding protein n=1 Tax=Candidatus Viridilinea mediisalina TaxID=2024553 RepID=A0A2A6RPX7_9CHLR|nr:single-stranded DNA-binding protein [Candidatus Viridilinea mediisalina]PDW04928.1 single-stranded DNA-binding protein [Candidatus Viridilinea mediisalina]